MANKRITGWSIDEWVGKSFADLIHPDELPLAIDTFMKASSGETVKPYELRILSKSGEYVIGGTSMGMSPVERTLVYEDDSGLMYWNSALRTVEVEAKKYVSSAGYRAFLEKTLDVVRQRHASKLLADLTKLGPTDNQDLMWSETDWFPRCLKAGLKSTALIMPRSLVAHMAVDQMSQRTDLRTVTRRIFSDVDEARTWLSRC